MLPPRRPLAHRTPPLSVSTSLVAVMANNQMRKSESERQLNAIPVSKEDLNRLVMHYLVIEGYKDAAESFSVESGLSPLVDLESIENRMIIRGAIQRGDVEEAIDRVNELDPEQQRLIELIRAGAINEALEFASEHLAPRGEEHPDLLPELERTMALLAFDISKNGTPAAGALDAPPHIAELLAPSQ
ncbi:hypothetical protein ACQY0O_008207 [Thecaphora frezii]